MAKELRISEARLRNWMAQADVDESGSQTRLATLEARRYVLRPGERAPKLTYPLVCELAAAADVDVAVAWRITRRPSVVISSLCRSTSGWVIRSGWPPLGIGSETSLRKDISTLKGTVWHIRALLVLLHLQGPEATYDAYALVTLRGRMGNDAFAAAASTVVDETQLAEIQAVLDSLPTDDLGGPEAR